MREFLRGQFAAGLLLVSVALNVFLLGMVAAPHLFNPLPPPPLSPPPPKLMVERLADSLSDDGRTVVLAQFDAISSELDQLFQTLTESQSDVMRQFANEPFDEATYRSALDARKQAADAFFSEVSGFFLKIGADLSASDRRRIVERGRI